MSTSKKQSSKLLTWHISLTAVFNSNLLSIWLITHLHRQPAGDTHTLTLSYTHTRVEGQQLAHHLSGSVGKCSDFQSQCDILIISMLACVQAGEKMMMASSSSIRRRRKPRMRWLTHTAALYISTLTQTHTHTHTFALTHAASVRTGIGARLPHRKHCLCKTEITLCYTQCHRCRISRQQQQPQTTRGVSRKVGCISTLSTERQYTMLFDPEHHIMLYKVQ